MTIHKSAHLRQPNATRSIPPPGAKLRSQFFGLTARREERKAGYQKTRQKEAIRRALNEIENHPDLLQQAIAAAWLLQEYYSNERRGNRNARHECDALQRWEDDGGISGREARGE